MNLFPVYPLNDVTIVKASGADVFTDKGERYLDFYGGHAVISIGHRHPHWVKRIEDQLSKIAFYSNSVKLSIQEELAVKLGELSGKKDYALFLCNSGAEANENALKLASFHNKRKGIVAFKKAFHGRTSLAVSVTDNPSIIAPVNENEHVVFLELNDEAGLIDYFKSHGSSVSSVIIEGIQGVGGIREASPSFLRLIRKLCDESGACFIADSVQCGYGRTGQFFSHDVSGVNADLYTTAKGMGNGFPVAGLLIHPKFHASFGLLGTTFGGNPLACAASLAVLEVMEEERLMLNAKSMGELLLSELKTLPRALNLRGRGLMIGFDLDEKDAGVKARLLSEFKIFVGEAKPRTIRLLPSLAIREKEVMEFLTALKRCFS